MAAKMILFGIVFIYGWICY